MNPAASGDWKDEDAARALLQRHVADIHPTPDLIDRVEAGIRQRRKTRRIMLPVTMLATAACVVALAFAIERTATPATHAAVQAGRPVITCPNPLPAGWMTAGVRATPSVPGAARTLLPGTPVAAVSCATSIPARTTTLTAQQLSATTAALEAAAPLNPRTAVVAPPCEQSAQHYRPLYLIFEYPDGTRLTVTAYGEIACDGYGSVSWYAGNGQIHAAAFRSAVLDSLAASAGPIASP